MCSMIWACSRSRMLTASVGPVLFCTPVAILVSVFCILRHRSDTLVLLGLRLLIIFIVEYLDLKKSIVSKISFA